MSLLSFSLQKLELAEGVLICTNQLTEIDGEPLGENYNKVFVQNARKPNVLLERPRKGITTVGESVGRHVAWLSRDVNYIIFL